MLSICSEGHEEIIHSEDWCPCCREMSQTREQISLCAILKNALHDKELEVDRLVEQLKAANDKIADMERENENRQH